ncbi:protein PTST homolog 2, chloroplastic [Nicotiana tomentosiformis]|uniref:protein PTST homolog 2, chloroplastic n=1 Tax=Nicotiana tomentosiformis TaxID=4098 RepID=UPI00051B4C85|nr:protein PTST homolog 2, chloroplastic-like [Nicotiana tomentosiformis]
MTPLTRPDCFNSLLSTPATPCKVIVLNPRKRLHFRRKSGDFDLVLGNKMCSLKFLELRRENAKHSVFRCCCEKGSEDETDLELEAEILAFMEKSENPNAFPTKKDLEKAGRVDLVEAIKKRGGWYSFGWDTENVHEAETEEMDFDIEEFRKRVEKYQESDSLRGNEDSGFDSSFGNSSQPASSSGRSLEAAVVFEEDCGIEGILNRLENERILSLGINTSKYEYGANFSSRNSMDGRSSGTTITDRTDPGENGSLTSGSPKKGSLSDSGGQLNHEFTPDMWRTWSIQRADPQGTEFEAGEISFGKTPDGGKSESSRDGLLTITENSYEALERWKNDNYNDIRPRLRHLELELSSTLRSLRSKSQEFSSKEVLGRSISDLENLSDAREFQENEVINAQKRLRSIRAKLAILEGKMALALIDADKVLEEKQKRIDGASKALQLLRTTRIVWHNSASEVLLTGSFDGWTTQRKMDKSHTGIFSVSLKLYPGRYEIKFIVDGIWKVDPLRPVVHNNGYENNLLIVT